MSACILRALVLALAASAASESDSRPQDKPAEAPKVPEKIKKDFGEDTIAILSGATRVEVFQLKPEPGRKATPATLGSNQRQWTSIATGKEKGKEFAARVRTFLLDGATRTTGWEPELDRADVALRLWKDQESVTLVIDFESGTFGVVTRNAEGKQTKSAGGVFLYTAKGEFDKKGERFARVKALAVEAFPGDERLQALKPPKEPEEVAFPPIGDKVPEHLLTALEKGEPFELLSLDPALPKEKPADDFRGYKVLGKTTVTDADVRKKLVAALKKGVEDNDGAAASCFNPRHGIRVTHDKKTVEFVICFECVFVVVYVDGEREKKGLRTTKSPLGTFNGVLKDAKVPLPKK